MKHIFLSLILLTFTLLTFAETKKQGDYEISLKASKADAIYNIEGITARANYVAQFLDLGTAIYV